MRTAWKQQGFLLFSYGQNRSRSPRKWWGVAANPSNRQRENCTFLHILQVLVPSGTSFTGSNRHLGKAPHAFAPGKGKEGWSFSSGEGELLPFGVGEAKNTTLQSSSCCYCTSLHHNTLPIGAGVFFLLIFFKPFLAITWALLSKRMMKIYTQKCEHRVFCKKNP